MSRAVAWWVSVVPMGPAGGTAKNDAKVMSAAAAAEPAALLTANTC